MRGKAQLIQLARMTVRITPAHAGKSATFLDGNLVYQDHPRTCGEKSTIKSISLTISGSPPHMRGKVHAGLDRCQLDRITPAHAGKSFAC